MKRILIISEHDAIERQLYDLVSHMFTDEAKEVYLCNIDIIPINAGRTLGPEIRVKNIGRGIKNYLSVSIQHFETVPIKEIVHADCCEDINKIIEDKKINYVVLPLFTENKLYNSYFSFIAKDIKTHTDAQVLGLLV